MSAVLEVPAASQKVAKKMRRKRRLGPVATAVVVFAGILVLAALLAPWLPIADPAEQDLLASVAPPSSDHLLGTDLLGRDLLSWIIWGTRTTLLAALVATVVATAIGAVGGLVAGYRRGPVDTVLNRGFDVLLTVPSIVLLLAVKSALNTNIFQTMAIFGILVAPQYFRVIRATSLQVGQQAFISAGRMSGCSHPRMLLRYVFPNVREQIAVQLSFQFGFAILVEAGISFIGAGVQPPDASLGIMLSGVSMYLTVAPILVLAPAIALTVLILACNLIGDALSEKAKS